ncbi:MAG: carboxylesterase family protein [Steroidobacteraceae bacterium]
MAPPRRDLAPAANSPTSARPGRCGRRHRESHSRGRYEGLGSGCRLPAGITAFKGIRYAQPPVGALRWKAPLPATAWSGVYAATELGPASFQPPLPEGSIYADLPQRRERKTGISTSVLPPRPCQRAHDPLLAAQG